MRDDELYILKLQARISKLEALIRELFRMCETLEAKADTTDVLQVDHELRLADLEGKAAALRHRPVVRPNERLSLVSSE